MQLETYNIMSTYLK